ncbi:MAG: isocitrate lyase/phosphoenolpyruvate mutase family protein [Alphaproteobacteria bacterium]|jgi:2-methylisocitrate lyase-like PEP mutase family enzyme|nr:isocitrate lyase/phosphoenolpyruvate mutase family protein [Alphaproteobacteria bacterium]
MSSSKIAAFRRLHESGCFVIPNPWDRGSAIFLQKAGFKALASTSAGFAWAAGRPDNKVTADMVVAHLEEIAHAVDLPLNADFEDGFAAEPEKVAANVTRAVAAGVAGLSIEDSKRDGGEPLYAFDLAVERIKAARAAIDKTKTGVLLTGRSEGFLVGRADLKETIRRLEAYSAAGADVLYAPGIKSKDDIAAVVKAVAPKPVNLLIHGNWMTFAEAADLGVRRISVGAALARAAWVAFAKAANEIAEHGTFNGLSPAGPAPNLNATFGG